MKRWHPVLVFSTLMVICILLIIIWNKIPPPPKSPKIIPGVTTYMIGKHINVYEFTPRRVPEVTCILARTLVCVPKSKIYKPPGDKLWLGR